MKTSIGIRLRAIPPANRYCAQAYSSMRAAARTGYTQRYTDGPQYEPRIIPPDEEELRQRNAWRQALAAKLEQLERLIEQAEDADEAGEASYWRAEIERAGRP